MGYWSAQGAQAALGIVYRQILGRGVDMPGLEVNGRCLVLENGRVREVVRSLGHSEEYRNSFVAPYVPRATGALSSNRCASVSWADHRRTRRWCGRAQGCGVGVLVRLRR